MDINIKSGVLCFGLSIKPGRNIPEMSVYCSHHSYRRDMNNKLLEKGQGWFL